MSGAAKPLTGSLNQLKKNIGNLIFSASTEIIELQKGYKKGKGRENLSKLDLEREKSRIEKKEALEDAVKTLESKPNYLKDENLEKFILMMKTTVETAESILARKNDISDTLDDVVKEVQSEAKASVEEIELLEEETLKEINVLSSTLSSLSGRPPVTVKDNPDNLEESDIEGDIGHLDQYMQERYRKIKKEVKRKKVQKN